MKYLICKSKPLKILVFFADLFDLPGLTRHDSKDSLSSDHSGKDENDEQWLSQVCLCLSVSLSVSLSVGLSVCLSCFCLF